MSVTCKMCYPHAHETRCSQLPPHEDPQSTETWTHRYMHTERGRWFCRKHVRDVTTLVTLTLPLMSPRAPELNFIMQLQCTHGVATAPRVVPSTTKVISVCGSHRPVVIRAPFNPPDSQALQPCVSTVSINHNLAEYFLENSESIEHGTAEKDDEKSRHPPARLNRLKLMEWQTGNTKS